MGESPGKGSQLLDVPELQEPDRDNSADSRSKLKRKDIILGVGDESDSDQKEPDSQDLTIKVRKDSEAPLVNEKKDPKSSFFPTAKGLTPEKEENSSANDSHIKDEEPDIDALKPEVELEAVTPASSKIDKLSHKHIVEFYPYEENEEDKSNRQINN